MAEKTISLDELRKLTEEGAEIEFDPRSMSIEQMGELIAAVKQLAENESARIQADLARNQTNLEVLAALQGLIKGRPGAVPAPVIDMSPLTQILEEIRDMNTKQRAVPYEFDVHRDGRGFLSRITATPKAVH